MCRIGIVILFLHGFFCIQGLPAPVNETRFQFANALQSLVNKCENSFLINIIQGRIDDCTDIKAYTPKSLQCLMFYDISQQLCLSFAKMRFDLNKNYSSKMNITQSYKTLCNDAKTWNFTSLSNSQDYKMLKILSNQEKCVKVCATENLLNEEANFYCKYYKWGLELLHNTSIVHPSNGTLVTTTKSNVKQELPVNINNTPSAQVSVDVVPIQIASSVQSNKTEAGTIEMTQGTKITIPQSQESSSVQKPEITEVEKIGVKQEEPLKSESEVEKPVKQLSPNPVIEKGIEQQTLLKPVLDNPNVKQNDLEDDPDMEFGNDLDPEDDPISDQDNGDADGMVNVKPNLKADDDKLKDNENIIQSPVSSFSRDIQREPIYPNTLPDAYTEEDDHFFPFFLSTIVFVVLLYVLYHNKGKFTKMALGLIVEGRQSNRRRSSRGHAYRRLDTLEQAMSTNSTAPPSKIIY